MNKTTHTIGAIIIVLIALGGFFGFNRFTSNMPKEYVQETSAGTTTINTTTGEVTSGAKTFTQAEVAANNTATKCYTSINGGVYDLTAWVNAHPGGKNPIQGLCGKDGTEAFMKKHKGGKKFIDILARFKVGNLS
jgi:cytochrome b involved in lipid metabolism